MFYNYFCKEKICDIAGIFSPADDCIEQDLTAKQFIPNVRYIFKSFKNF